MTAMPSDLGRKRPAEVRTVHQRPERGEDGQWLAVRGGTKGSTMAGFVILLILATTFGGFVLSLIQQAGG